MVWARDAEAWTGKRRGDTDDVLLSTQLNLMLGMLDVPTPPLFGLTSEEVKARSV